MDRNKASILATLCYSDIFDYPLTKAQLWRFLIASKPISFKAFEKILPTITEIKQKDKYFYLSGRLGVVEKRLERLKISAKKRKKIEGIIRLLSKIPTILFVGISGSVAMENAEKNADIDLFLITQKNTLWITRLFVLLLLQTKHARRQRNTIKTRDTVCVNMLIDSAHLAFPKKRQDMYTAHEVMQMKPIFSRDNTYEKFLQKNAWIAGFLLNSFPTTALKKMNVAKKHTTSSLQILEPLAKAIQIIYMKDHKTTETIANGFVAFHPQDYKESVFTAWKKRKQLYGI